MPAARRVSGARRRDVRLGRRRARARPRLERHVPRRLLRLRGGGRRSTLTRVIDPRQYRDRFPILSTCTYLINHSLAAMPAAAEDKLREYARTWRERGIRAWAEGWWEMPVTVGDQLGRVLGARSGAIVMHQNVTVAEAVVLSCFRPTPERNRIVYQEANFPSVRYLYQARPELEVVAVEDDAAVAE